MSSTQEPLISVVVPLYNKEKYIRRAVESVLNQTFQDFELIVVNDGSPDNGPAIVRTYDDRRIRLINQENRGVSAARNRGIDEARGKLVAFLDADDEWLSDFLDTILGLVYCFPEAGAYGTAYEIHEPSGSVVRPDFDGIPRLHWEGIIENYYRAAIYGSPLSSSSVAIPRSIFERVGGFPLGEYLGEDGYVWLRIALRYPIAYSSSVCAVYHRDAEGRSCINRNAKDCACDNFRLVEMARETLSERAIRGSERKYLQEYCAKYTIAAARDHILWGRGRTARSLLLPCRTRRFLWRKWFWYALSLLPVQVLGVVCTFKKKLVSKCKGRRIRIKYERDIIMSTAKKRCNALKTWKYDKMVAEEARRGAWLKSEVSYIKGMIHRDTGIELGSEAKVLQIGSGPVDVIDYWDKAERHAIDPLAKVYIDPLAKVYKERFSHFQDKSVKYVEGVGEDLPYQDDYFDVVIIRNALDHVENPRQVLKEAYRVLKPNGALYVWVYLYSFRGSLAYRTINALTKRYEVEPWAFTLRRIKKLLTENSFSLCYPAVEERIFLDPVKERILENQKGPKFLSFAWLNRIAHWILGYNYGREKGFSCVAKVVK